MKSLPPLRTPSRSWPRMLMAAGAVIALALTGCGDGETGPAGAAGSSGTNGTNGTNTGITSGTSLTAVDNAPGVVLAITKVAGQTGATGNFQVGDKPAITFTIKKTNGTAWNLSEMATGRIFLSGPTFNYQRVLPRVDDVITKSVYNGDGSYTYTFATGFPATYAAPYNDSATYGANDGELQGQNLLAGTYTVGMAVAWNYTVDGVAKKDVGNVTKDMLFGARAESVAHEVVKNENCNQCHVKIQAHGGGYQDTKMCVLCHTAGAQDASATKPGGIPGTRIEFKMMVHRIHNGAHLPSVNGVTSDPATGVRVYGTAPVLADVYVSNFGVANFSKANFPVFPNFNVSMPRRAGFSSLSSAAKTTETNVLLRGVTACYKCHGDPDGSGPLTAPSQGDLHTQQPSRRACGSCHDDVDFSHSYVANGMTMVAQPDDATCITCHAPTGTKLSDGIQVNAAGVAVASGGVGTVPPTPFAHAHPLADPTRVPAASTYTAKTGYTSGLNIGVTSVTGSAASYFVNGEKPAVTFTIKDDAGNDVPLYKLSAISATVTGPNENRQLIFPVSGLRNNTATVCDFVGRLVASSTTNKGLMSRVVGSTVSETLKVQFTSSTAFTVTGSGSGLVALGSGTLGTAASTYPTGASISDIELTSTAKVQNITVAFTSATDFTVTGSVDGAMGGGSLPASVSTLNRFTSTDGTVSFTVNVGTTAFASGNSAFISVFQTTTNGHLFAIVSGKTAYAAGDRFYYETIQNSLATYTYNIPMDIVLEFLGNGTGAIGDSFTLANIPGREAYWGRETVYERTATGDGVNALGSTTLASAAAIRDRFITVASAAKFAANDFVVLDSGVAGSEEYLSISKVSGTQLWFNTPLRYAHASAATAKEVTLTLIKEATNYTLNPTTGVVQTTVAVGTGNAVVASYRTDGAFGWKRSASDTLQAVYQPPMYDAPDLGQDWGEWQGLAYKNGTYTAGIWVSLPIYVPRNNEYQRYSMTSKAGLGNFLYGATGTVAPYNLISSQNNCDSCHDGILFHGGGRKGNDACVLCHGIAGLGDSTQTGATANFRTMLHKVHMGDDLTNASTYSVSGGNWAEVAFPAMPGKAKVCSTCHGTSNTAWSNVATRAHAAQTTPTKNWFTVCNSCHDSTATATHAAAMTTNSGAESCATCHGTGQAFGVDIVHKNR